MTECCDTNWAAIAVQAAAPILVSAVAVCIALYTMRQNALVAQRQWERDCLRRLCGYRYRLVASLQGQDGEPFVAINEALVVFAEHPEVIDALTTLRKELDQPDTLEPNLLEVIKAMGAATGIDLDALTAEALANPFTPPS